MRWRPVWLERRYWTWESRSWDGILDNPDGVTHIGEIADWLVASPVVDLGCGTGNYIQALTERRRFAVGVDFSDGMLARAAGKPHGALVRGDISQLPFRDGAFAGALSVYSLQFFEPGDLLAEIRRILAPGGALLVEVPVATKKSTNRRLKRIATRLGVLVGAARHHQEDQLRRDMAAAGFSVKERRGFPRSYALLCTNEQASPSARSRL